MVFVGMFFFKGFPQRCFKVFVSVLAKFLFNAFCKVLQSVAFPWPHGTEWFGQSWLPFGMNGVAKTSVSNMMRPIRHEIGLA